MVTSLAILWAAGSGVSRPSVQGSSLEVYGQDAQRLGFLLPQEGLLLVLRHVKSGDHLVSDEGDPHLVDDGNFGPASISYEVYVCGEQV